MRKILGLSLLVFALVPGLTAPAEAATGDRVIVLPGATSAEGIAAGPGTTFFAGDLFAGDIFRGDIRRGTAELFVDAPAGRMAVGMDVDRRHGLLFVAGGAGKAYVYDIRTGATVAEYDLADPASSVVNDVVVTPWGAWFTDTLRPLLYFVPVVRGVPGPARTLTLSGPAADVSGEFNLNGIRATPFALIVAHSTLGKVLTVNPRTGSSAVIEGIDVSTPDGLEFDGFNRLWVVENFANKISEWRLSPDLSSGTLTEVITSPAFAVPTTAAKFGHRLAAVNSHLDTGFPPTAPTYEVVVVDA